jgi:hypothetical protein
MVAEQIETMPASMQRMIAILTVATRVYKALNPATRISDPFKFVRNTGARKQIGCVLCGASCPGWSARYPRTTQSITWEREHAYSGCAESYLATHGIMGVNLDKAIALAGDARDQPAAESVLADMIESAVVS